MSVKVRDDMKHILLLWDLSSAFGQQLLHTFWNSFELKSWWSAWRRISDKAAVKFSHSALRFYSLQLKYLL